MLTTTTVLGCEIMDVNGITFVRSRSNPAVWYRTTYETCECKQFRYRPYTGCRHVRAVSAYNQQKSLLPVRLADVAGVA